MRGKKGAEAKARIGLASAAVLIAIISINILGVFFGYMYYESQLKDTQVYLWVFVPDCPLYVGLFALLAILYVGGIRSDLFGLLVSVGLMKYGAWTLFVLAFYNSYFFSFASWIWLQSTILFILHIGMVAEGFVLPFKKAKLWQVGVVLAWFLLNDALDYFGPSVHPWLPTSNVLPVLAFSLASTFAFTWLAFRLSSKGKRIKISALS